MDTKSFLPIIALAFACCTVVPPPAPQFVYCAPATFANCTIAKCSPKEGGYSCNCFVDSRYSATAYVSTCVPATATTAQSRFHPIESYQECTKPRQDSPAWAWCLGVKCTRDSDPNSTAVACDCTAVPAGVKPIPYIVVTPTFLPGACRDAGAGLVWSSATPGNVSQITSFLQKQPGLQNLQPPVVISK
jgi:hypothetical protein